MQGQITPGKIQIGAIHKKQHFMKDEEQLAKEGGYHKINAIKVYTNDKYVIGFVMYYKLCDGDYLKAGHNVPKEKKLLKKSNKIKSRVFEIGPDDYLLEIAGHYDDKEKVISRLTFTSYRGKIGNYGSDVGTPFKYKYNDYTFGPLTSGYKDFLEYLEVSVVPVPRQFLNEFRPIQVNVNISDQQHRDKKIQYKPINPMANNSNPNSNNGAGQVQYQGVYVNQNQSSYGQVKLPSFNLPSSSYSQPNMQQNQPPMYQQSKPNPPPNSQNTGSGSLTSSKYPQF